MRHTDFAMKLKRGGKRKGAGRKPLSEAEKRITRSVNLEKCAWQNLDEKAAAKGLSASYIVNQWAKRLRF